MKTFKLKNLILAGMASICLVSGIQNFSFAQYSSSANTNENKVNTVNTREERSAITGYLEKINLQNEKVKYLKEKYKKDKANENEKAMAVDKKELCKALADLKRDKAYLKAEKMDLVSEHNLAINDSKEAIKKDKSDLKESREKLDKNLAEGNEADAAKNAKAVAQYQNELDNNKDALHKALVNKNSEIILVNKEIEKSIGQYSVVLYAENAIANTKNWIEK